MRAIEAIAITDPTSIKRRNISFINNFFEKLLNDKRDLPFIYLTLEITFFMISLGIALFFLQGWLFWVVSIVYFYLNNLYFKGPFGLMLHCTSHRKLFKKEYNFLNYYLPWIVAPFFGHTPETYFAHHIGMHHVENNLEEDKSSTMHYQRDSIRDFLRYFGSFLVNGVPELYQYHKKNNRPYFMKRILAGELSFYLVVIALCFINFPATFMVFILPFLIFRVITMMGNWSQHSFLDPQDPGNLFTNSITCINVKYNHKCWNDGYHINHHLRPNLHWTQYPVHFQENLPAFAENKSIVFEGLDYLKIFILLMKKDYETLSNHVVNINNMFASKEEIIDLMKERTRRVEKVA